MLTRSFCRRRDDLNENEESDDHEEEFYFAEIEIDDEHLESSSSVSESNQEPLSPSAGPESPSSTNSCLLYTSPSPRDRTRSRMPSSA